MTTADLKNLEDNLWHSADVLRANTGLKSSEYSTPVLGLIFLKFADNKYKQFETAIMDEYVKLKGTRREKSVSDIAVEKCGFYLPDHARYDFLLNLPEEQNIAKKIKEAMAAIEEYKPELDGVLPKEEYSKLVSKKDRSVPSRLLRAFADIPQNATGDLFGKIYEYFLGKFAMAEGQGGGEFFTPNSVVRLMVEIIEPHKGTVYDPACGSGGMFVQSAHFIEEHLKELPDSSVDDLFVYGQEKTEATVKLAKMNLAVNGLRGKVMEANTYHEDPYESFGKFDYVMANPPFNVDDVSLNAVENDKRFNTYGVPRKKTKVKKKDEGKETVPNANYLWINLFATSLKPEGRAALVMANSASDARHSEADIRQRLIEGNLIYGMLTLPSNMFYTVTLPATLWFFDKAKKDRKILFIDARNIFRQIDRAHREFTPEQIENIGMISKLHKGQRRKFVQLIDRYFERGMQTLAESQQEVGGIAEQLVEVLDDEAGKEAVSVLLKQWGGLKKLNRAHATYEGSNGSTSSPQGVRKIDEWNKAQHKFFRKFEPFFAELHAELKQIDKTVRAHEKANKTKGRRGDQQTKQLKEALEKLHGLVKTAESFFLHIHWLQERFPKAKYEDVTGLCKLASPDEVAEQDYSLNPGRYVGVVIEEDGKTEEDF